jgi:hypothetical protein
MTESELDEMLAEVGGSCNFDNMLKMFQTKMAGGNFCLLVLLDGAAEFPPEWLGQ